MDNIEFTEKVLDHIEPELIEYPLKKGRRIRRIIVKWVLPALLLLVLLLFIIPIPVHKTWDCLEIDLNDPFYQRDCVVTAEGYYHLNLFSSDKYVGSIRISHYMQTNSQMSDISISQKENAMLYSRIVNGSSNGVVESSGVEEIEKFCFGQLASKPFFNQFVICVDTDALSGKGVEPSENGGSETPHYYYIIPNVETIESARQYLSEFGIITAP